MKLAERTAYYSCWNDPENYRVGNTALDGIKDVLVLAAARKEQVRYPYRSYVQVEPEQVRQTMDAVDESMVARIGYSKYLLPEQLRCFLKLEGIKIAPDLLHARLERLEENRVIKLGSISQSGGQILFAELDVMGNRIACDMGAGFHRGNQYLGFKKRNEMGLPGLPEAKEIKRALIANQILLCMLHQGAAMERFGLLETVKPSEESWMSCQGVYRCALKVDVNEQSVFTYEVLRNTGADLEAFAEKLRRYYCLRDNADYLDRNFHEDRCFPQLVVVVENREHSMQVCRHLKDLELLRDDLPLLFAELSFFDGSGKGLHLYEIRPDGSLAWYGHAPCPKAA